MTTTDRPSSSSREDSYMVRPYGVSDAGPVGTFDGVGGLTSSLRPDRLLSDVLIEAPSMQSRRITATILVEGDVDEVWQILTDYDNLSTHVPNLVQSYRIPARTDSSNNDNNSNRGRDRYSFNNPNFADNTGNNMDNKAINTRIFQEGAQKILGFDFRASLKMDMSEDSMYASRNNGNAKNLQFKLAESFMFSAFEGSWIVKPHSRIAASAGSRNNMRRPSSSNNANNRMENDDGGINVSQLTYNVFIKPRGPVPVAALEWRIKEDIPVNLLAVKKAVEEGAYYRIASRKRNNQDNKGKGLLNRLGIRKQRDPYWDADETLESYIS